MSIENLATEMWLQFVCEQSHHDQHGHQSQHDYDDVYQANTRKEAGAPVQKRWKSLLFVQLKRETVTLPEKGGSCRVDSSIPKHCPGCRFQKCLGYDVLRRLKMMIICYETPLLICQKQQK